MAAVVGRGPQQALGRLDTQGVSGFWSLGVWGLGVRGLGVLGFWV